MYALLPQTALYHLDPFIFIGEQSRQMYPLAFNSTHEEFHSIPLSTFDYSPVKSVYFKKWHIVKGYRFTKDKHDNHLNYFEASGKLHSYTSQHYFEMIFE